MDVPNELFLMVNALKGLQRELQRNTADWDVLKSHVGHVESSLKNAIQLDGPSYTCVQHLVGYICDWKLKVSCNRDGDIKEAMAEAVERELGHLCKNIEELERQAPPVP